jgi:hypothetical protein
MRTLFVLIILMVSTAATSQTLLPSSAFYDAGRYSLPSSHLPHDSTLAKPWSLTPYGGFSTSFLRYNGGSATVFSAPMGLQLNRRLTNNLYAFAGVSVAPAYVNFNHSFLSPNASKFMPTYGAFNPHGMNLYSRAELGLMYVNDEKTFSISGSIGIERSSYPMYPAYPMNGQRQQATVPIKH